MLRSNMAGRGPSNCAFSRDHAKRTKCDTTSCDDVGLASQSLVDPEAFMVVGGGGTANTDEDLVNVLLSAPSLKTNTSDDFLLETEPSGCMSLPWMPGDGVLMPGMDDMQQTDTAIMKRVRSTGNFILISEDPNDMVTPFLVNHDAVTDRKGEMTCSPSSDGSSDDCFVQEKHGIALENSRKQFKLACLAGYLKSLVATTSSSRHVASGVPCITPRSIEECLVPRKYAADDLVQCFFDGAKIRGSSMT